MIKMAYSATLKFKKINDMRHVKTIKALCLLTILGFIWGSGYTLAKYAMMNGVPPLGYSFWQALGPAILLSIFTLFSDTKILVNRNCWQYFLICGLLGIAIPNTNMYFIASHIPAGLLAVLVNTVPLIVYPLALISRQEQFDIWRLLAVLLGMVGIVLIVGFKFSGLFSNWTALALISPLCFALCSLYISAKQPIELNSLQAATGMLLAASVLLVPVVLQQNSFYSLVGTFTVVKQVIVLEIVLSTVGYLIFFYLVRLAGPVFYSLTGGIVALTGLFWGYVIFAEKPSYEQTIASGLVVSAIFMLSWRQSQQHTEIA